MMMMNEQRVMDFLLSLELKPRRSNAQNLICKCPFAAAHFKGSDSRPSFTIEITEKNRWHCFSCGRKGGSFSYLLRELGSFLGKDFGDWYEEDKEVKEKEYKPTLPIPMPDSWKNGWSFEGEATFDFANYADICTEIPKYALERGITVDQAKKWRLGYNKRESRLFIPIFDHNKRMVGWSGRTILEGPEIPKYKHAPGFKKKNYFYGEEFIDLSYKTVFLSEGFMDVWSLDRAGVKNPLAYFGRGVGDGQIWKIMRWVDRVVICPHNDEKDDPSKLSPGEEIVLEWKNAVERVGKLCVVLPVLKGKKDVGDWSIDEIRYVLKYVNLGDALC